MGNQGGTYVREGIPSSLSVETGKEDPAGLEGQDSGGAKGRGDGRGNGNAGK